MFVDTLPGRGVRELFAKVLIVARQRAAHYSGGALAGIGMEK